MAAPGKSVSKRKHVQDLKEDDLLQISKVGLQDLINSEGQAAITEPSEKKQKADVDNELDNSSEGKCEQGNVFSDMLAYTQNMLGFEPKTLSDDVFYSQYSVSVVDDLPLHDFIKEILAKVWKDANKEEIPHFLGKKYRLAQYDGRFPQIPKVNAILSSMVSPSSLFSERSSF
ncbi:hypothetical protein NDU88_000787 [Pleurodeles waltl]|uniref:Uncharacterized protein n=1 Tax=Pleurodeles waltl TaxID=8319 RepID=A0AAV7LJI5_PLEWA|nr:hypothetical protein NDU88_000787 [Pleurodeles waltl]